MLPQYMPALLVEQTGQSISARSSVEVGSTDCLVHSITCWLCKELLVVLIGEHRLHLSQQNLLGSMIKLRRM